MTSSSGARTAISLGRLLTLAVALPLSGAGVVHIGVAGQHLDHAFLAASFVAMGSTQLALAGLLVMRPSRAILGTVLLANLGILVIWATTRLTALPFIAGLGAPQPVGVADVVATLFEVALVSAASFGILIPRSASASVVPAGQRYVAALGGAVLLLTIPGLMAPHSHGGAHGAGHASELLAEHGHVAGAPTSDTHGHGALTYDQAESVLTQHAHGSATIPTGVGHEHRASASAHSRHEQIGDGSHAHQPGAPAAGHDVHGEEPATVERPERRVLRLGEKQYATYEPRTDDRTHGRAFRWHDGRPAGHHASHGDCRPSASQQASADAIVRGMKRALSVYDNNPWNALRDGFVAYPIPLSKMFHMVAVGRYYDRSMVDPMRVESFMYAMTDEGLTAVGGMFIFPYKERTPPNPTGCLMIWHQHTGGEGLVTSFDPQNPDQSVAMAHVWTHGGLEPWGRDFDGTEPHMWFFAYRHLPAFCAEDGDCI